MRCANRWWAGAVLWALASVASAATGGDRADWRDALPVVPAEALQRDVDTLESAYGALHPGLHRYLDDRALAREYAGLRRTFRTPQRLDRAFLGFSAFSARVRCGHTFANPANQREAVQRALMERPRLPLQFRWLARTMVVTADEGSGAALPPGTRVLALDGVPTPDILAALLPYARADGHNDDKRIADLQRTGEARHAAFDVFYPLLFPRAAAPTLQARVQRPGERRPRTVALRMRPYAETQATRAAPVDPASPLGWTTTHPAPGVAVLRMPDWSAYHHPDWDWQADVDRVFADAVRDGIRDLVVDIRGNEGGSGVGEALIAHLVDAPAPMAVPSRSVRYRRVPDALRPALSTWDDAFYDWGDAAQPSDRPGFFRLTKYDGEAGAAIAPRAPRFRGRVWVLIGPDNSSATFEFAETVQRLQLGTLVGEPTGGNRRGINGGAFLFLTLPGSGIELDLPLIAQFPDGDRPDAGLQPDLRAVETADSIAAGRDVAMEAVRARIAASR